MANKNLCGVTEITEISDSTKAIVDENGKVRKINLNIINALAKKRLFIYTKTAEIINDTGYHGVSNSVVFENDYSDFTLDGSGTYLTYTGNTPCLVSGFINVKVVNSGEGSSYVQLRTGIYNDAYTSETITEITPSVLDDYGRWYMIPFSFSVKNGDRFWFLWTHADSAYIKIEEMKFNLKIDAYI